MLELDLIVSSLLGVGSGCLTFRAMVCDAEAERSGECLRRNLDKQHKILMREKINHLNRLTLFCTEIITKVSRITFRFQSEEKYDFPRFAVAYSCRVKLEVEVEQDGGAVDAVRLCLVFGLVVLDLVL